VSDHSLCFALSHGAKVGRTPRLSKAGWLRAAQTGRLVKSRSVLIDFREALLIDLVRCASICKEAARLYQPPRQRYALPLLLKKEESFSRLRLS
jgi:hypothetical protein